MALSEKRKGEIKIKAEEVNELVEYLDKNVEELNTHWNTILLYLSSENLVKHSKTLSIWTIVIGTSTILLFLSAVIQLIKLFISSS